jgi:hypothetical protein
MHLRRELAIAGPVLALGLIVAIAVPVVADASVGLGIQAGPVRLAGGAHPGGTYPLPAVYVINTGTQDESVVIRVEHLSPGAGRAVPSSWVQATGSAVKLSGNQSARIPLQLTVPRGAQPGAYLSDVVAKGSAALGAGGANLGVAAATKLQFTVVPGAVSASLVPGWLLPAFLAAAFAAAAVIAVRRSGLRIRIERRPAGSG